MGLEVYCTEMCRACMKNDCVLLSMYDDKTISSKNLPSKLAELASIHIDRYDGLPNMLCAKCAYRTNTFYDFKLQVQATEKKLRMMFQNQTHNIENELNEKNNVMDIERGEFSELISQNDQKSVHNLDVSEELVIETNNDTNKDEQEIEIDISHLDKNNGNVKESSLYLDDVFSNPQESSEDHLDMYSAKTEIPEEISKILELQQLDYTIMYISESMIESITESSTENVLTSDIEQEEVENQNDIFIPAVEILDKEESVEQILNDICISNPAESSKFQPDNAIRQKHHLDNNITQIKNRKAINKENSFVEQSSRAEDSHESDSDYFIDPKDNILGSLNDTIMRIKELKEGDAVEYQCTLCLQNYDKLTGILLHTIDNHVPSSGPFYCVVCEKDCKSHRELRAHAKTHTGRFPYSCFICDKAYTMKRYLKRHMVCHTDFPRHRCPKCGIRFKVKAELETHVRTHVRGAPYTCSQCPRLFNHKGNYKRHLISHLDPQGLQLPKYPCKICGKRFLNNRTLETHTRVHTGERPFKCEACDKSFSQQGNLLNHKKIHANPRSYTCEICNKSFNQHATLKDHRLLHTGEKPHVCNVCGVAFTFSAALRRHMWIHKNDKPFGCEICQARFVGKYDLRRHMQVHTDRPKVKRKKITTTLNSSDSLSEEFTKENLAAVEAADIETELIEQVLLPQDVTQVTQQVESEKENVDALFNFIQYD